MATTRYFFQASQEHFRPEDLLRQAVEAEQWGFDGIASSDHLQPWWEGGESGHTWPWLGGAGQATSTVLLGTGVPPRGDGFWTLADPERVPKLLDVYRGECEDLGKEPGEIVLHSGFSWAADEETALEGVRVWKGAQPDDVYRDDIHVPAKVYEHGEE